MFSKLHVITRKEDLLEDFYAAGCLLDELLMGTSSVDGLSDAALAALEVSRCMDAERCLLASRVGRMMSERSLTDEVRFSARRNAIPVVPRLEGEAMRRC